MNQGHILLVEDEAPLLEIVSDALQSHGFQVTTAVDAGQALVLARGRTRFDHIVSDVIMPEGRSGIELVRQVATLQPQARIILVSGLSKAQLPPLPEGVTFLPKPYRLGQLLEQLGA